MKSEQLTREEIEKTLTNLFSKRDKTNGIVIYQGTNCQGIVKIDVNSLDLPKMCDTCNCGLKSFYEELDKQLLENGEKI